MHGSNIQESLSKTAEALMLHTSSSLSVKSNSVLITEAASAEVVVAGRLMNDMDVRWVWDSSGLCWRKQ